MKKIAIAGFSSFLFGWNMQGFTAPTNSPKSKTWCYQGEWKNNFQYGNYSKISQIEGGEACWIYSKIELKQQTKDTYQWKEGWNFVTPIYKEWNLNNKLKDNALIGWSYQNGNWKVYNYNVNGIEKIGNLKVGEGIFLYIPKIEIKINSQALFCKNGKCSEVITSNKAYKFYLEAPKNKEIKFALDLYRYSNKTHYKLAIGPIKTLNSKIPVCVEKEGVAGSCGIIDNRKETFLSYEGKYLVVDAQKVANHFKKSIPNTKEKFLVKFYIEGFNLDNFTNEKFGTLGIENFGTWVSLKNSKKVEFEMEIK